MKKSSTISIEFTPNECVEFSKFANNLRSVLVYFRDNRFNEDVLSSDEVKLLKSIDYVSNDFHSVYELVDMFSKLG